MKKGTKVMIKKLLKRKIIKQKIKVKSLKSLKYKRSTPINVVKTSILAIVVLLTLVVYVCLVNGQNEYKQWSKEYSDINSHVDCEKYRETAICMANIAVGLDVGNDVVERVKGGMSKSAQEEVDKMINSEHIIQSQDVGDKLNHQMNELFGGTGSNPEYDKYSMSIASQNYFYPDTYVYKLINKENNSVIVTIYINKNGGVDVVKTST